MASLRREGRSGIGAERIPGAEHKIPPYTLTSDMHVAHVFIGRFDLPVPLSTVLVAAMAVVAASFGLIYLLPPRPPEPEKPGPLVPRAAVMALQALAVLTVAYLAV